MKRLGLLLLAVVMGAGCAIVTADVARLSSSGYAPLPKGTPIQLSTGDIDKKYDEIAVINLRSSAWAKIDELNEELRENAREIGANAVVRIQYGHEGMWGNPTATGTAVLIK